jgi:glycosyltransferase involved in cell wall biosynthesis
MSPFMVEDNSVSRAPVISIILPTRNRASQLKHLLDRLIADEYPHKEIIVCDGASTDETVELLKSYGSKVRWVSEQDGSEYDARNKALRMAAGDLMKYMSDDDIMLPGIFGYAADFFERHSEVDFLFGQAIWFDDRKEGKSIVCDTRLRDAKSIDLQNLIRMSRPLPTSETVFFRRRVIERIGFFDCSKRGADYDYWARAAQAGCVMRISPQVFVHYHLSAMSGVERNNVKMLLEVWERAKKYGNWRDRVYVLAFLIPFRLVIRGMLNYVPILGKPLQEIWRTWKTRDRQRLSLDN